MIMLISIFHRQQIARPSIMPERAKGAALLLAYGVPRLQVRRILFYQWISEARSPDDLGTSSLDAVPLVRAVADSGGATGFAGKAKRLALPVPQPMGRIWSFHPTRPEIVDEEVAFYLRNRMQESLSGQLFTMPQSAMNKPLVSHAIQAAQRDTGYMSRVESGLETMAAAARPLSGFSAAMAAARDKSKTPLAKSEAAKMEKKRAEAKKAAVGGMPAPVIAAGLAAAALGGIWAWKKYSR